MGTQVQALGLDEAAVRGERFADHHKDLKNFADILCLTHPEAVTDIHRQYLAAGADIVETNTFGASPVGMEDFALPLELVREINLAAVACARRACDEFTEQTPDRPRFVAGSIGPTTKQTAIAPTSTTRATAATTFDEMVESYYEQVAGAGRRGRRHPAARDGLRHAEPQGVPVRDRALLRRARGAGAGDGLGHVRPRRARRSSGQTVEAFWNSVVAFPAAVGRHQLALGPGPDAAAIDELQRDLPTVHQLPPQRRPAERDGATIDPAGDGRAWWASSPRTAG